MFIFSGTQSFLITLASESIYNFALKPQTYLLQFAIFQSTEDEVFHTSLLCL